MFVIDPPYLGGSSLLQDIKKGLKEIRRKKYAILSDLSYDLFMMKTSKSISKIFTTTMITDSQKCQQIATKVFIYMKLRREFFLQFFSNLANLIPTDESAIITCTYAQSKLMKYVPREFLKKEFISLINKQHDFPINLAYLAYTMIKESSNLAIFCIQEFINLLSQIIFNPDQKVRLIAFDSLNITLKILNDSSNPNLEQIIINLFLQAKNKLTSNEFHEQHGSFLMLSSIFQNLPHQIKSQSIELLNFFISTLQNQNLHSISLYNIVILSKYDKESFLKNHYNTILDIFYDDICSKKVTFLISYCFLIYYLTFSEQLISNETKMTEILESLIKQEETIKQAYQIIHHISRNHSFFIRKNEKFFISLFQNSIQFIDEIANDFVDLMNQFPNYFDIEIIGQLILGEFDKNHSLNFIEFLSFCPFLNNSKIEEKLFSMLYNRNLSIEIRRFIPSAILRQLSFDDREIVCNTFRQLFMLAFSDRNSLIRLSVIESFKTDLCLKYLTLPAHLDSLTKLAHDDEVKVRNSAIFLLGKISKFDPINVHIILRDILLEHMFSIDMKSLQSMKSQISFSLLPLIKSSIEIFPLYCSTFCDIALRELSNTPSEKLTYFEQKFFNDISINIIKSVRFIAKNEISLLNSHLKQFVNFFIWQIQQEISKEIKFSIIKTLYVMLTKSDTIEDIDMNQLNLTLMKLSSKMNSTKINREILKLVGFIGVTSEKVIETETFSDDYQSTNSLSSDPSYFISVVCQTLFEILNDRRLISYHMSCLKSLSVIFANDSEMAGPNYFSKFIMILIEQVRSTNYFEYISVLNHVCIYSPRHWVMKYKSEIINLAQEILEKKDNSERILDFIPTLCSVFKTHADFFYQNGISFLYEILEKYMKNEMDSIVSLKCLNAIVSMRFVSLNFCFINVPKLLRVLSIEKVVPIVKCKIVDSFSFLFQQPEIDMSNFLPEIFRSLSDLLFGVESKNEICLAEKVMQSLFCMMVKCGDDFRLFENQATFLIDSLKIVSDDDKKNYHAILNKTPPYSFNDFEFIIIQSETDFQNIHSSLNLNINEKDTINGNKNKSNSNINNEINGKSIIENEAKTINNNENKSNSNINNEIDTKLIISNENYANSNNENDSNNDNKKETKQNINKSCLNNENDIKQTNKNDNEQYDSNSLNTENNLSTPVQSNKNEEIHSIVDEESIKKVISIPECKMEAINWKEWYNHLVTSLITLSPSPFISSCSFLCEDLITKAAQLFQTSFLSIWIFLTEKVHHFITETFTNALQSDTIPNQICTSLILLIEFLERNGFPMQISKRVICHSCEKCYLYSNSFYFAYKWVVDEPLNIEANEAIIHVLTYYGQMNMKKGLSKVFQLKNDTSNSPDFYELIGDWSTARMIYENRGYVDNFSSIMKCLFKEEKWNNIIEKIDLFWSIENKEKSSKFILSALYHLKKWEKIGDILPFCQKESIKVLSILALYQNFEGLKKEAIETIEKAFDILAFKSKGIIKNDKKMINKIIIKSQQLNEIYEIVLNEKNIEKNWEKRIKNCPKRYEFFNKILSVRLNKMTVESNLKYIVKMLNYALKEERYETFYSSLNFYFPDESKWPLSVAFLHCKSIWFTGKKKEAIDKIGSIIKNPFYTQKIEADQTMKCKINCTFADWLFQDSSYTSIFYKLKQAVDLLEISMRTKIRIYKSYHLWAWCCSLMYMKANNVKQHAISAIHGFLECIKLKQEGHLSDLIQMISLFFHVKFEEKSFDEISQRIGNLNDENFLLIIPQIFAQISSSKNELQSLFMANILMRLLPNHYHVLLPNLLFDREKNQLIQNVSNWFSKKNAKAFNEGMTIKKGLVLCSSSSAEYWQIDLTKAIASILKKNWQLAIEILNRAVKKPPQPGETEKEAEFRGKIDHILNEILANFRKSPHSQNLSVKKSKSETDLTINFNSKSQNSIEIEFIQQLKKIHSSIKDYLYGIQYLSMFNVAPELFLLRNSIVAVPGTYDPFQPKIFIKQFDPTLDIYNSKQRPRFLVIYGDDGSKHKSLLKGREDLRLDSRLMQFFELINEHINIHTKGQNKAKIFSYSITPITKRCGLIQFVEGADTIFSLVTEYRRITASNVFAELAIENSVGSQNVDSMRPIQRVEALREAALKTGDDDLRKMIWLKTKNFNFLMEKTIMFSETCAIMSIVGYVLGIGDRHPSNILIQRSSGRVIHIDFGDSFEAAKRRKFFPELIPFRLTRMMVKALGPSEIEGNFRIICEKTLNLLRRGIYSFLSILEIFVIEPIEDPLSSDPKKTVYMDSKKKKKSFDESVESDINIEKLDSCFVEKYNSNSNNISVINSCNYEEGDYEDYNSPDMKDRIKRVGEKIVGRDMDLVNDYNDNNDLFSVKDQVSFLIRNATDEYNLAYLYHGWTPLW